MASTAPSGAPRSPRRTICLVPVTDFCEWEGEKGSKLKRCFNLPSSPIHAKAMPVILHPEDYDHWLDGEVESACSLAQPFPSRLMRVA